MGDSDARGDRSDEHRGWTRVAYWFDMAMAAAFIVLFLGQVAMAAGWGVTEASPASGETVVWGRIGAPMMFMLSLLFLYAARLHRRRAVSRWRWQLLVVAPFGALLLASMLGV